MFSSAGVVNAFSYQPGLVPGSLAIIFGTNLSTNAGTTMATGGSWPTTLQDTSVTVGGFAAPLYSVTNNNGRGQINFQVPWELQGLANTIVTVTNSGRTSAQVIVPILSSQPAIYTGAPRAALVADVTRGEMLSNRNPAHDGDILTLYATGLGSVSNRVMTGEVGPGSPYALTPSTPIVTIGGNAAEVQFSGLAPGYIGLYQLNIKMPPNVPAGEIPLFVTIDGRTSNAVTITAAGNATSTDACLIFVHGSRDLDDGKYGTDWLNEWNTGRDYWRSYYTNLDLFLNPNADQTVLSSLTDDFIWAATGQFKRPFAIVRYNGAAPYWSGEAAGEVARQLATITDDGGPSCRTADNRPAEKFLVIAHSMGATVMDFILGNATVGDRFFDTACEVSIDGGFGACPPGKAPFSTAVRRIAGVVSVGGAHKGSDLADVAFGRKSCRSAPQNLTKTDARLWLQTDPSHLVENFTSVPVRKVWLIGGFFGAPTSLCLPGQDDAILSYASQFACRIDGGFAYDADSVCNNANKQKASNFLNVDTVNETHDEERNNSGTPDAFSGFGRTRASIPNGLDARGVTLLPDAKSQILFPHLSSAARIDQLLSVTPSPFLQ